MSRTSVTLVLCLATGCGRWGFDGFGASDAPPGDNAADTRKDDAAFDSAMVDAAVDAVIDAPMIDATIDAPMMMVDASMATCVPTTLVCEDFGLGSMLAVPVASGTTFGQTDSFTSACGGNGEPDHAFQWLAPSAGRYVVDTRGSAFNTLLSRRPACGSAEVACNDDDPTGGSHAALSFDAGECESMVFVVDGIATSSNYNLNIRRKCPGTDLGQALGMLISSTTFEQGDSYSAGLCGGSGEADVTLMWQSPTVGRYVFDTRGSAFNTVLSVRPSCTDAVITCNDDDPTGNTHSAIVMDLPAGQNLVFVVDGATTSGPYVFSANRKCPGVEAGTALGLISSGSTFSAGDGYSSTCGGFGEPDQVVTWRAPSAGRYVFDTRGSGFDTTLSVRTSCTGPVTVCNDDDPAGGGSHAAFTMDLAANQELLFVVDGVTTSGNYQLNANKKCPAGDAGTMVGVIASASTFNAGDSYSSTCGGSGLPDRVAQWTVPSTGRYVIDTRGSAFDTVLSARDSCTGPVIACNDEDPTGGSSSALVMDLTAGQQLTFVVDGVATSGNYTLRANHKCPATDLGTATGTGVASASTFTQGDAYGSTCGGSGNPDVAMTWTAPASGTFRFDTNGSAFDTVLSVRGTCTGPVVSCDDDSGIGSASQLDVAVIAGQQLVIIVDGISTSGNFQLTIAQL